MGRASGTPILAVITIGILWGLNWPTVKFLLSEVPPITIRAVSFPIATIVLAVLAKARGERLLPKQNEILPILITGLLVIFGFNILTTLGQMLTETSRAVVIAYTMPGMTAVLAALILSERLAPQHIAAVLLAMGGLAVLASEDFGALLAAPLGPLIMLGSAFSWALGNVSLKSRDWSLKPLGLTVWFFFVSSILCGALAVVLEPPWEQTIPSRSVLLAWGYHILGPMVVCYALWTMIVGRLPASVAAITALLAPAVGMASAVVLIGDPVSWQKTVALACVLVSILLALLPSRKSG
jgi:drug/metabolite transporter (DMT)-like permease